jgi:nitrogen regulatory protein PII
MIMHPKKRVEIFIEAPLVGQVMDRLNAADVSGYSVMPIVAGRGLEGAWAAEGQISSASQMMMVICVTDAAKLEELVDSIYALLQRQIGFLLVSDVNVIRPGRF